MGGTSDTVFQYNTNVAALKLNSSGTTTLSSIIFNNEARLNDDLFVAGNVAVNGTVLARSAVAFDGGISSGGFVTFGTVLSNINIGTSQTTGTLSLGGPSQTAAITLGQSTVSQTTNIQAGITASGSTKTINLGTNGAAGSTTAITIGASAGTSTVVFNSGTNVGIGAATPGATLDVVGSVRVTTAATQDGIILAGRAGGTGSFEVTISPTTLTADRTLTLADGNTTLVAGTTAVLDTAQTFTAAQTFRAANAIRAEAAATQDAVVLAGRAGGTSSFAVSLTPATLTSSTTLTLPNVTGTLATLAGAETLTNKILQPSAGTATAGTAPLDFSAGTNLTVPEAGSVEYDGTVFTFTPNTSFGRAVIATPVYTLGASPSTTLTLNTNVPLFPAANDTITLPIGTYLVETEFQITVATSTVSATVAINFSGGGTAVGTRSWTAQSSVTAGGAGNMFRVASAALTANAVVTATSAIAGRVYIVRARGIIRITTAGTVIPSVQWSATLTSGVLTWEPSNNMVITPLATSSTANFTGAFS